MNWNLNQLIQPVRHNWQTATKTDQTNDTKWTEMGEIFTPVRWLSLGFWYWIPSDAHPLRAHKHNMFSTQESLSTRKLEYSNQLIQNQWKVFTKTKTNTIYGSKKFLELNWTDSDESIIKTLFGMKYVSINSYSFKWNIKKSWDIFFSFGKKHKWLFVLDFFLFFLCSHYDWAIIQNYFLKNSCVLNWNSYCLSFKQNYL